MEEDKLIHRSGSRLSFSAVVETLLPAPSMIKLIIFEVFWQKKISQQSSDEWETAFFISSPFCLGATFPWRIANLLHDSFVHDDCPE